MTSVPRVALALAVLLGGVLIDAAAAAKPDAPAATSKEPKGGGWVFSFLPKSLQKNPRLDFNIMTEMTPEGRKVPPATPEKPVYYVSQAGGVYNGGIGAEHNFKTPPVEKLKQMMERSLAETGYLSSENTSHAPALVIFYHWGSHSFQPPEDVSDENGEGNVPVPERDIRKALLDRALLLGGGKFAREVSDAMLLVDQKATMQRSYVPADTSEPVGGSVGDLMPDPFDQLRRRSPEMERLVDELFSSSFFVVASAYDYAALGKGQRRILWRTKMTVNSLGVNMLETIPPLIATAGPYFGRPTENPVVITKRVSREGKVEIGTPTVVPDQPAAAQPAAGK